MHPHARPRDIARTVPLCLDCLVVQCGDLRRGDVIPFHEVERVGWTACFDCGAARREAAARICPLRHRHRFEELGRRQRRARPERSRLGNLPCTRRESAAADQMTGFVPHDFAAEVLVALGAAPGRKIVMDVAIARKDGQHSSFVEPRQRRPDERKQSTSQR